MNKNRRKELDAIAARIAALQAEAESIRDDLETIRDDEQEYRDNMPESLADSEKGQAADEAIGHMEQAMDDLGSFIDIDFKEPLAQAKGDV